MPDRRVQLQTPLNTDAGRAARVGEIMRDAATRLRWRVRESLGRPV